MLETRAVTTPSVVEQLLAPPHWWSKNIYSSCKCLFTVIFQTYVFASQECVHTSAAHCGRAFRMAFTSSATAVSANSNWS